MYREVDGDHLRYEVRKDRPRLSMCAPCMRLKGASFCFVYVLLYILCTTNVDVTQPCNQQPVFRSHFAEAARKVALSLLDSSTEPARQIEKASAP